jgi:shikimate 5-dehydrogenase
MGVEAAGLEAVERLCEAEVIINTTSVGMSPDVGASPVSAAIFRRGQVVMDAIYTPPKTRFLREAEEAGAWVISGLWMFLEQARAQIALFTGQEPPEEVLQRCLWGHLGLEMGECLLFPEESTRQ